MKISKKIHTKNAVSEIMRAVFSKVVISLHFLITKCLFYIHHLSQKRTNNVNFSIFVLSYFLDFFNSFEPVYNFAAHQTYCDCRNASKNINVIAKVLCCSKRWSRCVWLRKENTYSLCVVNIIASFHTVLHIRNAQRGVRGCFHRSRRFLHSSDTSERCPLLTFLSEKYKGYQGI